MDANFVTHKLGPFPLWAWIAVSVALLLVITSVKKKKAAAAAAGAPMIAGVPGMPAGTALDPQTLTVVNEGYNPPAITINNPAAPAVGGRSTPNYVSFSRDDTTGAIYGLDANGVQTWLSPDMWNAAGNRIDTHFNSPVLNSPIARPAPAAPAPPPSAPAPRSVTVAPWTAGNTPWNSTLSGIAQHFYNDASQYTRIAQANGIANPDLIYAGQQIVIP